MNDENDIIYTQFKHGINNKNKNIETNPNANSKSIKPNKTKHETQKGNKHSISNFKSLFNKSC